MRATQKENGLAPRYDNRHRNLTPEEESDFKIELSDGILNINFITPPNRSKMNASDWLRGKKWRLLQAY